jgi:hypothetical protein
MLYSFLVKANYHNNDALAFLALVFGAIFFLFFLQPDFMAKAVIFSANVWHSLGI